MRDLVALPKAHLHLHLEAGMSPGLLAELSAKYGREVPVIRGYGSFAAFADTYVAATDVLRERDDWERLADDICATHVADGAVYLEPSFWAGNYRHRFARDEACWELVFDVFAAAAARHGLSLRWMVPVDRVKDSPSDALALARFAAANTDHVVSFGLHNDEVGHPPQDFVAPFRMALDAGLLSTPHAGELESGQFVADSVDLLGASRIGHGVRSFEVPGLVERLAAAGTCLDVCPTSNIMLSVFPSFAEHPLPALLDAGVRCSLNGDDPLLFGPGLLEEYELVRKEMAFDDGRLAAIARSSIECSGAADDLKAEGLSGIDA
ncbi:MAG TPA: adenosine deaminase, partial [Acidimicrobiales bacterium]